MREMMPLHNRILLVFAFVENFQELLAGFEGLPGDAWVLSPILGFRDESPDSKGDSAKRRKPWFIFCIFMDFVIV